MVRIMIVDDHALMRRVVREVIEKEDDLEVVAEACNGLEAQEQAAHVKPEVVLMDLDMPECDGFEGTERVLASSPESNVVIFTASHQERHLFQALQRGAWAISQKISDRMSLSMPFVARHGMNYVFLALSPAKLSHIFAH